MRATFFKGTVLGAVVGSLTLVSTVAVAGTGVGGIFNLGQSNSVNAATTLTGATSGKQLQVTNSSTGVGAQPASESRSPPGSRRSWSTPRPRWAA